MPGRRALILTSFAAALVSSLPGVPLAETYFTDNGLALRGYDPVAYFQQARPVRGTPEHSLHWGGAEWRFASAENRAAFVAAPEAYAPQYGGYCAWAVSQGYTAPIDPNAWRIVDGRLYLNYSRSIHRRWERDIPGHIQRADANWPALGG
ncbi:MAG: YHS domain-containing (seleno)protein [Pararhodobacter sp.]